MSKELKDLESGEAVPAVKHREMDKNVKIALVVGFYFATSMLLVFLNKRMFSVGEFFFFFFFFSCVSLSHSHNVPCRYELVVLSFFEVLVIV
jgi:hypothetical protein